MKSLTKSTFWSSAEFEYCEVIFFSEETVFSGFFLVGLKLILLADMIGALNLEVVGAYYTKLLKQLSWLFFFGALGAMFLSKSSFDYLSSSLFGSIDSCYSSSLRLVICAYSF